jgi:hypothetical protein
VVVLVNSFQLNLMFEGKVGSLPLSRAHKGCPTREVLPSWVGSEPYSQTLDKAGKDFQGKTLQLIRAICE